MSIVNAIKLFQNDAFLLLSKVVVCLFILSNRSIASKLRTSRIPRVSNYIADVRHAGYKLNQALEAETKT